MKTTMRVAAAVLLMFALLLLWANWNPPSLSARYHSGAVTMVLYRAGVPVTHTDSMCIQQQLRMLKGVTAVAINNQSGLLCIACNEHLVNTHELDTLLQRYQPRYRPVPLSARNGPQCPVPAGWLNSISHIQKWLNFRS